MTTDYSKTIHLPKTDFPRRAGLAQKEPKIAARWEAMDLYQKQRDQAKGRKKFILHWGPPFPNGHMHIGHALTYGLKDIVCRSYQALGYDAPVVFGYDCHGLPIEWKIEENYRKKKKNFDKDDDPAGFRQDCRNFAQKWIGIWEGELQRVGINADLKTPYVSMHEKSEALIAKEIHTFLKNGSIYQGSRPVMWSVPEQTTLAEAEVEYKDITSDTVFVGFPVKEGPEELKGAAIVIWTTTPWTLPGNRAIGCGQDIYYSAIQVQETEVGSLASVGDKFVVADTGLDNIDNPLNRFFKEAGIQKAERLAWNGTGFDLSQSTICHHPLHGQGYNFDVPLLIGDFVTTEAGTGFVHIAPGHGEDDHRLGTANGIEVPETVGDDGKYMDHVPLFAGAATYWPDGKKGPANKLVMEAIENAGHLIAKDQIQHSYPHSWRSKAPVIFRTTPQWFIAMDHNNLRQTALGEIKKTRWIPGKGENRITSMVEGRGDWCISRQRTWGVPLSFFVNKKTKEPLVDEKVLDNIISIYTKEGSDAWYTRPAEDFLGPDYNVDDYEKVTDIIDVWFESGSTQSFVLEEREELQRPADLYLEGSDQHRGWFQSSLLVGCGTRGNAPFKTVLTHGFILDEKGYKMSKSQGNVTDPMKLCNQYGADILRLWIANSDYTEDIKFGESILKGQSDIYRRVRGTFCFLLGNLNGFDPKNVVDEKDMPDIDRYMLHRLYEMDQLVREYTADFEFQKLITALHHFCTKDLSAFYFDICKDALYCEARDSIKRRSIVTVLDHIFVRLTHWLAPFLCFTAEEAWLSYKGLSIEDGGAESIHLLKMPKTPKSWKDDTLAETFDKIIAVRRVVTNALEPKRAAKDIGSSLEAAPVVHVQDTALAEVLKSIAFEDVCITSGIEITNDDTADGFTLDDVPGVTVTFQKAEGDKCERCWKYTQDIGSDADHPSVCARCAEAVKKEPASKAA